MSIHPRSCHSSQEPCKFVFTVSNFFQFLCEQGPPEVDGKTGEVDGKTGDGSNGDETCFSCGSRARGRIETEDIRLIPFVWALDSERAVAPYKLQQNHAGNAATLEVQMVTFSNSVGTSHGEGGFPWSVKATNGCSGAHRNEGAYDYYKGSAHYHDDSKSTCIYCGGVIAAGIEGDAACNCLRSLARPHESIQLPVPLDAQATAAAHPQSAT
jgi:hypothetical protein